MASPNRPARLNRSLLLASGVVLLASGGFSLGTAFGVLPLLSPDATVLPATPQPAAWVPWVAAIISVIIGLLCLRWLLAQTVRRPKTGSWRLSSDPRRGDTRLDADTAAAPLVTEIEAYPGVHQATARLSGSRDHPMLHLVVATEDHADISELRGRIDADALPRLCRALDLERLDADLLLRLDDARSPRAL